MPGGRRVSDDAIRHDRETSLARYHANSDQAKKVQKHYREQQFDQRKFIGWDGEGYTEPPVITRQDDGVFVVKNSQHHYMLFGSSTGDYVTSESLDTAECLDLIMEVEQEHKSAYHVGFAFEYDVNMILKNLPWRTLAVLKEQAHCRWKDQATGKRYRIEHVPHKWFRVSAKGISATIYDVFGFFHCSYIAALDKYDIGSAEKRRRISDGKSARGLFTFADLKSVTDYWKAEISLLPPLMDEIRKAAYGGGYRISEWHGPGALANYLLREMGVINWHSKKSTPPEVRSATRYAYAGGRFTPSLCGLYYGPVYTADINSAYIFACSLLPRMDRGKWIRHPANSVDPRNLARFGLYKIEFDAGPERRAYARKTRLPEPPYPLFHRSKNGVLRWPRRTQGWYWTPEAQLVANSPRATILEAWVWDDDGSYPFGFVNDAFHRRLELQHQGNPVEKTYKWALAAMYGAFARRVGWDKKLRKAPPSHELAWAGFITSWCRANVWGPAMDVYVRGKGKGLISIDTDGVTSTVPFREEVLANGVGENLGQWKLEEWTGILQWQNGIYWLRNSDGEWKDPKSRGIPKGSIPFASAYEAIQRMDYTARPFVHPSLSLRRTRFVGYGQALQGQFPKWRQWITEPVKVLMGGNPMGKAFHFPISCSACRAAMAGNKPPEGSLDGMHTITGTSPDSLESWPHKLPWLEEQHEIPDETTNPEFNLIVKDGDM
jgi:hypothetical protein